MGRQVSTSGARAYTARCLSPGARLSCPVLSCPCSLLLLLLLLLLLRMVRRWPAFPLPDPSGCARGSTEGASWHQKKKKRAPAGATRKKGLQHRRAWGASVVQTTRGARGVCVCVCACVRVERGVRKQRGGVSSGDRRRKGGLEARGAVRVGRAFGRRGALGADHREVGEKGPRPLSLSLFGLSLGLSSAGGAPRPAPRERPALLLSSGGGPFLILILFHMCAPLPLPPPSCPPLGECSADPASLTAAPKKGLCWGACRLYPGLRGCFLG